MNAFSSRVIPPSLIDGKVTILDIIRKAAARRSALIAELNELDTFVAMYRRLSGETDNAKQSDSLENQSNNSAQRKDEKGASSDTIVRMAHEVILERNAPMNRSELVNALSQKGITVGGIDKPRNIGTIVWRSKAFESTEKGYWPKDTPMPGKLV